MKKIDRIYRYVLEEDLIVQGGVNVGSKEYYYGDGEGRWWLKIGPYHDVTVRAGYAWDGCSPKFAKIGPLWIGTIDTKRNWKASCVHDALYQYGMVPTPYEKKDADIVFHNLLVMHKFRLAGLYYWAVDKFGKYQKYDDTRLIEVKDFDITQFV